MRPLHFWGTALLAAAALGAAIALLFPFGALGIEAGAERERGWLLAVWTAGVMAICFGASGLLGAFSPITFRDVADAGSVLAAVDAKRESKQRHRETAFYNFAGWTVSFGGFLLLLYFVGWLVTGR
jgi:hypothetical protein